MSVDFLAEMKKKLNAEVKPYPGLRPFETEDSPYFFGRENQVNELVNLLRTTQFLSVIGSSGSGKSSLVKAGLLPRLYKGLMSGDEAKWNICLFRPGNAPMEALSHSLLKIKKSTDQHTVDIPSKKETDETASSKTIKPQHKMAFDKEWLEETLTFNSEGLINAYNFLELKGKLLVIVDQFEELFRYKEENEHHSSQAKAFVDRLIYASQKEGSNIFICITMRSDFMGNCSEFYNLPETIGEGFYLVPRMSRDELKDAIVKPAQLVGAKVDPVLVEKLANEVEDRQDQLPLLQHALMRSYQIWKKKGNKKSMISLIDYKASGGMSHALSDHANDILKKIEKENDERFLTIVKRIFQCITKGDGKRGVRRPVTLGAVFQTIKNETTTFDEIKTAIGYFRDKDNSLLMPPEGEKLTKDTVIDISHESLMRNWDELKKWLEEEEDNARTYKKLLDAYHEHIDVPGGQYLSSRRASVFRRWKRSFNPTEAWANRYGGAFNPSMTFLNSSYIRKRLTKVIVASLFIGGLIGSIILFYSSNEHLGKLLKAHNDETEAKKHIDNGAYKKGFELSHLVLSSLQGFEKGWGNRFYNLKNKALNLLPLVKRIELDLNTDAIRSRASNHLVQSYNTSVFQDFEIDNVKDYRIIPGTKEAILIFQNDTARQVNLDNNKIIGEPWGLDVGRGFELKEVVFTNVKKRAVAFLFSNKALKKSKILVYSLNEKLSHKQILSLDNIPYVEKLRFESNYDYMIVTDTEGVEYLYYKDKIWRSGIPYDELEAMDVYNNYDPDKTKRSKFLRNHNAVKLMKYSLSGKRMLVAVDSMTVEDRGIDGGVLLLGNGWKTLKNKKYPHYQPFSIEQSDWVFLAPKKYSDKPLLLNMKTEQSYPITSKINAINYEIPRKLKEGKYLIFKRNNGTDIIIYDVLSDAGPKQLTKAADKAEALRPAFVSENINGSYFSKDDGAGTPLAGNFRRLELLDSMLLGINNANQLLIWNTKNWSPCVFSKKGKKIKKLLIKGREIYGLTGDALNVWQDNEESGIIHNEVLLNKPLERIYFSNKDSLFYGWDEKGDLHLGSVGEFQPKKQTGFSNVNHLALHHNQQELIYLNDKNEIRHAVVTKAKKDWSLKASKFKKQLSAPANDIQFISDTDEFITVSENTIKRWKLEAEDLVLLDSMSVNGAVTKVKIAEDKESTISLYIGTANGRLIYFKLNNFGEEEVIKSLTLSNMPINDIDFVDENFIGVSDGRTLYAITSEDEALHIKYRLEGESDFKEIAFSKEENRSRQIYTLSENGLIKRWNLEEDKIRGN